MVPCPLGFYCPENVAKPIPCNEGSFGEKLFLTRDDECTSCTKGYYCGSKGLLQPSGVCDPGYVCYGGASQPNPTDITTGEICPEGGYCPAGSYEPWSCPPGTFAETPGQVDASDCSLCTAGFYCSGSNQNTVTGSCMAGCYCNAGSYYECQEPCPPGHFCPEESADPTECPRGTYQPQDRQEFCLPCPPGFQCPDLKMEVPEQCTAGNFCGVNQTADEFSTESDFLGTIIEENCGISYYSSQPGIFSQDQCYSCPRGHFCNAVDKDSVTDVDRCTEGFVCDIGSSVATPGADSSSSQEGNRCEPGNFCLEGTTQQEPCPYGTYYPNTGLTKKSDCLPCNAGYYCNEEGLNQTSTNFCKKGYYCETGAIREDPRDNSTGGVCPEGYFCGVATADPNINPCQTGVFGDESGRR